MKVSNSWEGALPLNSHFEMYLQKGSVFCIRGGGAFTLSVFNMVLTSVDGVVSVGVHVLLQGQVVGPSGVDVTNS